MTRRRVAAMLGGALAAALVAVPAAGFVRTSDADTGVELAWPMPAITYLVNTAPPERSSPTCAATAERDPALDVTRTSFGAWEESCSSLRLVYGGTTDDLRTGFEGTDRNVVVFRQGWCSNNAAARSDPNGCYDDPDVDCGGTYNCFEDHTDCPQGVSCADRGVVALTSVLYDPRNGRIMDADIEVNGWDGLARDAPIIAARGQFPEHGWYFTCGDETALCASYGQGDCGFMDLQNTVTHEAGHFIGLGHVAESQVSSTMNPNTSPGDVAKRTLSQDDVEGVCAIYPRSSSDGGGCGSAGAGGGLSLLLAAAALALRRRPPRAGPPREA